MKSVQARMRLRKTSRWWRFRWWLGERCQVLAWRLLDPLDDWVISYTDRNDGRNYVVTCKGTYGMARVRARELNGTIDGTEIATIAADDFPAPPR